jgi:radical SAM superfamily enzyme YgiQ (UPF0313 family)
LFAEGSTREFAVGRERLFRLLLRDRQHRRDSVGYERGLAGVFVGNIAEISLIMPHNVRRILLVQLPIPPAGAQSIEGNVPLAAAFLKLHARRQGLEHDFEIDILPTDLANSLGDQGLLEAILQHEPDLVGFTCYLWNIERSLWLAERIKLARPEVKILLGGPEITADNRWVLENAAVDHAILGEGELAFSALLNELRENRSSAASGLFGSAAGYANGCADRQNVLDPLDAVSSPYLEGILNAGENRMMLLETVRGCRFQCKYCYYSKRNHALRYLSYEQIEANLRHAIECGVGEVFLLDPTINQRADFTDFLRLLERCNAGRQLTFSGELRAEGIDAEAAKLLRAANFTELEIGLQSVEPRAHRLMGRPVNLEAWQRGVRCLMAEEIRVRLDLIIGLPGDTADSIRRGIDFLAQFRPAAEIQIFNLSILPGTEFRRDAVALRLKYQARPPYYVHQTAALDAEQMFSLMEESQKRLEIELDAPDVPFSPRRAPTEGWSGERPGVRASDVTLDLDDPSVEMLPPSDVGLVTTLLLRSADFSQVESRAVEVVAEIHRTNPHITLQIVLAPHRQPEQLRTELMQKLLEACFRTTSYLDRFYSMHPGHLLGAKRVFVLLPLAERSIRRQDWIREIGQYANILWHGNGTSSDDWEEFEHFIGPCEAASG